MAEDTEFLATPDARSRTVPLAVKRAVLARDGMTCQLCGTEVQTHTPRRPDSLHLDHIEPFGFGGETTVGNLRVTCAECNLRRAGPPRRRDAAEDRKAVRRRRTFQAYVNKDLPSEQHAAMQAERDRLTAVGQRLTARQRLAWRR